MMKMTDFNDHNTEIYERNDNDDENNGDDDYEE